MRPHATILVLILGVAAAIGRADDKSGGYTPPSRPRTEAQYGRLYMEVREADGEAGKHADRLHPQPDHPAILAAKERRASSGPGFDREVRAWLDGEEVRIKRWSEAHEAELSRRLGEIAVREKTSVDELHDIRAEGDVRQWGIKPEKRARLPKTEEMMRSELSERRDWLALARQEALESAAREAKRQKEMADFDAEGRRVAADRDAAKRATGLIRIGQNLEKSGKTKGALDTYRRIVKEHPDTPQAKAAAARITAMGGE